MSRNKQVQYTDEEDAGTLWSRFLDETNQNYSSTELQTARLLLDSPVAFFRLVGRLVLLDFEKGDRNQFVKLIENECSQGLETTKTYAHDLLYLQFGFTAEDILRPALRDFLFAAARSDRIFCRQNSAHLLSKVASLDQEALALLKNLAQDENELVRKNSAIFLDQFYNSR
jgi:hypothetical protein